MSTDGRKWTRIRGPIARQLVAGFSLLQGAVGMLAEPNDEVYLMQAQVVNNVTPIPANVKQAMARPVDGVKKSKKPPISDDEIIAFAQEMQNTGLFKKKRKK